MHEMILYKKVSFLSFRFQEVLDTFFLQIYRMHKTLAGGLYNVHKLWVSEQFKSAV